MGAFTNLPFQFQQRGVALADTLKDPRLLAQFTESRDQDLEDYLAGLHGARVSFGLWASSPATAITSGSGPQTTNLPFVVGTNGFENYATDGFTKADGSPPGVGDVLIAINMASATWNSTGATGPGFGVVTLGTDYRLVLPASTGDLSFGHISTVVGQYLGPFTGDAGVVVSLGENLTDLQTSTGTLGTINELQLTSAAYLLYIVE